MLKPFQVKLPDGNQEKFSSVEKMNKILNSVFVLNFTQKTGHFADMKWP